MTQSKIYKYQWMKLKKKSSQNNVCHYKLDSLQKSAFISCHLTEVMCFVILWIRRDTNESIYGRQGVLGRARSCELLE